jgi:hypothetical protein
MPGINDSTLVYGILDLIRREIGRQSNVESMYSTSSNTSGGNPLEGTPHVILEREHPEDSEVLTGVKMYYPSGWMVDIQLILGMTEEEIEAALAKNQYSTEPLTYGEFDENDTLDEWSRLSAEEQAGLVETEEYNTDSNLGTEDLTPVLPEEIKDRNHPDFEFFAKWRLNRVMITVLNSEGVEVDSFSILLIYDYRNFLVATLVQRDFIDEP